MAVAFQNVPDRMKNQIIGGSIFRMISDLGDPGVILLVQDIGSEQTNPFTSEYRTKVNDLFQLGKLFRLPLEELPDQVRYKMEETAPTVYLFPDD